MTLGTNTVLSVKLLQLISTSFSFHVLGGGKHTQLCKIILACPSSFLPCHLFHTAQTIISQQNGKKLRYDSSQLSPKSVLTQPSCSTLYWSLSTSQIQVADTAPAVMWHSEGHRVTLQDWWQTRDSHDNTRCAFLSLVRTPPLQKQLQKVAISAFTKHIRLLNANLAFQKGLLQGERAKEQIQGFFCWGSGIHFYNGLSADLWATLPPTVSDIRSARVAERSMEQLRDQLAGERSRGLWGIKK